MCNTNPDEEEELLGHARPFLVKGSLRSQEHSYPLQLLIDTGATGYAFIDRKVVSAICERLDIEPFPLSRPKRIRGFDGKVKKQHILLPHLYLQGYKHPTCPMFITDLGDYAAILGLPWMKRAGCLLDPKANAIVFPDRPDASTDGSKSPVPLPGHSISASSPPSTVESPSTASSNANFAPKVLPRAKPEEKDNEFQMCSIGAASYTLSAKHSRRKNTHLFACTMEEIDNELALYDKMKIDALTLSSVDAATANTNDVKSRLPEEYHDYLDVFDRGAANKLPPNRSSDHKIELIGDAVPPQSRAYKMSQDKLTKVKEYLSENLSKGFITPSKAAYSSPVLFALKANGDLRFCVDYRKLNALTKRNRYPLPLIDEVIGKLRGCKHLTRLDIIAAFNKIRDLTTFTTGIGQYKYRVLPFGLTNGPSTFQQYINDVLWEHLSEFCQAYLDDILIYSHSKSEHRKHVRLILNCLRKAGLQVDIKKCEFDVEETMFLGVPEPLAFAGNPRSTFKWTSRDHSNPRYAQTALLLAWMHVDVKRFVRNCRPCQRTKPMDFITGLPDSGGYNAICTIIDRLSKERHYVPCHWGEGGTSTEETIWILLWNVFRLHGLPDSIVSDRGSQFISKLWKALCERLRIKANLSTAYHPETDGQSERANQDVKRGIRTYCNYMQDDWSKWLPMVEFADLPPFYLNKGFHPRMSFAPNTATYERLLAMKADDIAEHMEELL